MADAVPNEKLRAISARAEAGSARASGGGARARAVARRGAARRGADPRSAARRGAPRRAARCRASAIRSACSLRRSSRSWSTTRRSASIAAASPRACLDPIWNWICRDLMPQEARTYIEQVQLLLAANEKNGAEQVARAFQDLAEQRMRECLCRHQERRQGAPARRRPDRHAARDRGRARARRDPARARCARRDRLAPAADHQQSRRRAARKRQGAARFPDRAPSRRLSLCAAHGDEPARLAVAADPPRHSCGRERCRGAHRRDAVRRRGRRRAGRSRPHDRQPAR